MMRRTLQVTVLGGLCLLLGACKEQPFEPNGAYNGRLAVYGILRSGADTQYVRVYSSSSMQAPQEVRGATVTLSDVETTIRLRDTTVI